MSIPKKHQGKLIPFLKDLFTGKNPHFDPTEEKPIPAKDLYNAMWKRTGWGKPPEIEMAKTSGGQFENCRSAVRHMLEEEGILICSNKKEGQSGYYRPTKDKHFDDAAQEALGMSEYYRKKAQAILNLKPGSKVILQERKNVDLSDWGL